MSHIPLIILCVFLVIFIVISVMYFGATIQFGKPPKPKWKIPETDRKWCRRILIGDVAAVAVAVAWLAVDSMRRPAVMVNDVIAPATNATVVLENNLVQLGEPSGLTFSGLTDRANPGTKFALAVDDEQEKILFALWNTSNEWRSRPLSLSGKIGKVKDLEAIAYDGAGVYYAITSHRQIEPSKGFVRKLIRFQVDPTKWTNPEYRIDAEVRDLAPDLGAYLQASELPIDTATWLVETTNSPHPYALEIEGLACRDTNLLIGLKWPLDNESKAILLSYSWDTHAFNGLHRLNLNGRGISDLAYDERSGHLFVVSNPTEKERKEDRDDELRLCGESIVHVFSWEKGNAPKLRRKIGSFARNLAKLEGLTIVGEEVWLAYDGPDSGFLRRPVTELFE